VLVLGVRIQEGEESGQHKHILKRKETRGKRKEGEIRDKR
jgi:hypothetical protein